MPLGRIDDDYICRLVLLICLKVEGCADPMVMKGQSVLVASW